jgi:hypothetical protein
MRPQGMFVHVMMTMLLLSGCGKTNDNCPGLCPDETIFPTMTISTADGSASIASARILSGPCTHLLIHSSGEVGMPTTYAAVQVTYNGPRDAPLPLCLVELTSQLGQIEVITAQVTSRFYRQTCCLYGACCPTTSEVTEHYHVEFEAPTLTVSFPPPPDGGAAEDAASDDSDTASDSPSAMDVADVNPSNIDLVGTDSQALDLPAADEATVDSAEPLDLTGRS